MIRETFPPPPPPPPTFWISDSAEDAIWFLETIHRPRERGGREKGRGRRNVENAHRDPSFLPPSIHVSRKTVRDSTKMAWRSQHVPFATSDIGCISARESPAASSIPRLFSPSSIHPPQGTKPGSFPPAGDDRSLRRPIHPPGREFNNSKKRSLLSFPLGDKSCYVRHFAKKQKRQLLNF